MLQKASFFFIIAVLSLQSCNPDCDSATAANIQIVSADAILAGRENQVLLRSSPTNFLEGRQVFIDDPILGPPNRRAIDATFDRGVNGLIVTIPEEIAQVSTPSLYVDDPDCSSDFILVDPIQIRTQDFFFFSDVFVIPPMPIVVIPTIAVTPPASITNAWITPYDRSYCIWFVPELDDDGNELSELRAYIPGVDDAKKAADPDFKIGSREFIVCGLAERHSNAEQNSVSGFVDKEAGIIEFQIDRTGKNLGVERFTGIFINPDQLPNTPDWRSGGSCDSRNTPQKDFMLVTSQSTGLQLLMIKAG